VDHKFELHAIILTNTIEVQKKPNAY